MTELRKYSGKDVEMLLVALIIAENAIANQDFLQENRGGWASPFFQNFITRINTAMEQHLGVDNAKNLRLSTIAIKALQKEALIKLSRFNTQLREDFKATPDRLEEILTELGFNAFWKAAFDRQDQEALIQLLYQFSENMTPELLNEITAKGIGEALISNITAGATATRDADIRQEGNKGTRKEITQAAVVEFNEIYEQLISIAKISRNLFLGNDTKRDLFSYSKVLGNMNNQGDPAADGTTPPPDGSPTT